MLKWFTKLLAPKRKRVDLQLVSYDNANSYLTRGYVIAPEEDRNQCIGFVWLEKYADSATELQS